MDSRWHIEGMYYSHRKARVTLEAPGRDSARNPSVIGHASCIICGGAAKECTLLEPASVWYDRVQSMRGNQGEVECAVMVCVGASKYEPEQETRTLFC